MDSTTRQVRWDLAVQWFNLATIALVVVTVGLLLAAYFNPTWKPGAELLTGWFIIATLVIYAQASMPMYLPPGTNANQLPKFWMDMITSDDYVYQRSGEYIVYNESGVYQARDHYIATERRNLEERIDFDRPVNWQARPLLLDFPLTLKFQPFVHPSANGQFIDVQFHPL